MRPAPLPPFGWRERCLEAHGPIGESFYLEARNIANTAYIASASIINQANLNSPLFEPGTGRAVYAGMKVRW